MKGGACQGRYRSLGQPHLSRGGSQSCRCHLDSSVEMHSGWQLPVCCCGPSMSACRNTL